MAPSSEGDGRWEPCNTLEGPNPASHQRLPAGPEVTELLAQLLRNPVPGTGDAAAGAVGWDGQPALPRDRSKGRRRCRAVLGGWFPQ